MKLMIDLDDAWADDETIAQALREAVEATLRAQVQAMVREELKLRRNELLAVVKKRLAKNIQHLEQEVL
jgi:3-keto-L-gulonate-6-phosphate decarboxylase